MGLKKIQNLFKDTKKKEQVKPALSLASSQKKEKQSSNSSNQDKSEIEAYIKSINEKLKDPSTAKKAAQILEGWTKKN